MVTAKKAGTVGTRSGRPPRGRALRFLAGRPRRRRRRVARAEDPGHPRSAGRRNFSVPETAAGVLPPRPRKAGRRARAGGAGRPPSTGPSHHLRLHRARRDPRSMSPTPAPKSDDWGGLLPLLTAKKSTEIETGNESKMEIETKVNNKSKKTIPRGWTFSRPHRTTSAALPRTPSASTAYPASPRTEDSAPCRGTPRTGPRGEEGEGIPSLATPSNRRTWVRPAERQGVHPLRLPLARQRTAPRTGLPRRGRRPRRSSSHRDPCPTQASLETSPAGTFRVRIPLWGVLPSGPMVATAGREEDQEEETVAPVTKGGTAASSSRSFLLLAST